ELREGKGIDRGAVPARVLGSAMGWEADGCMVGVALDLRGVAGSAAVDKVVGMGHRVLVVSAHAGQEEVLGAISAGARGYLSKDADGDDILHAIREIAAGNSYVSPTLASFLLDSTRPRAGVKSVLSDRERQV